MIVRMMIGRLVSAISYSATTTAVCHAYNWAGEQGYLTSGWVYFSPAEECSRVTFPSSLTLGFVIRAPLIRAVVAVAAATFIVHDNTQVTSSIGLSQRRISS